MRTLPITHTCSWCYRALIARRGFRCATCGNLFCDPIDRACHSVHFSVAHPTVGAS